MESIIEWTNTKAALKNIMKLLNCTLCDGLLKNACSFRICQHLFCKSCALELVNDTKSCPECDTVLWKEHMQESLKVPEVVSICRQIKYLIYKDGESIEEDNNNFSNENSNRSKVDSETNTYEFSEPDTEAIRREQITLITDDSEREDDEEDGMKVDDKEEDKPRIEQHVNIVEKPTNKVHTFSNKDTVEQLEDGNNAIDHSNDTSSNLEKPLAFVNCNQSSVNRLSIDKTSKGKECTLTTPPVLSQFSNVITKSETRRGVQKNPRRMLKKPKVTYDRRKLQPMSDRNKQLTQKRNIAVEKDDEYSIFDFCSGGSGKEHETPKTTVSTSAINEETEIKNTLTSPCLNTRRKRSKRRRINLSGPKRAKEKANVAVTNSDGNTFVDLQKDTKRFKHLTAELKPTKARKAQLEKKNKKGETTLHTACIKGNIQRVLELLQQGAEPNTKDFAGWTPLHEASNHGFSEVVEILLQYGAFIDSVAGDDLDTPLHDAVSNNRVEVVKILVEKNAPINIRNKLGLLPVDYATTDEMRSLLQEGTSQPNVDDDTRFGESSADEEKVFVTTNIKQTEKANLVKCMKALGGGKCLNEFDDSVTHVICGVDDENLSISRTLKYWHGLLCGKWLVSYQWVLDSQKEKYWMREADYEVKGTLDSHVGIPRKARINRIKMLPKLFEGCSFFLSGEFDKLLSKGAVAKLIKLAGGKLLSREPKTSGVDPRVVPVSPAVSRLKLLPETVSSAVVYHAKENSAQACCTHYIIYDEKKTPAYTRLFSPVLSASTVAWVLDCISNFEILDIKDEHEKCFATSQS